MNLNLTEEEIPERNIRDTICLGSSIIFNNVLISGSGIYLDTIMSEFSCDTIVTLNLEVIDKLFPMVEDTFFIDKNGNRAIDLGLVDNSSYDISWFEDDIKVFDGPSFVYPYDDSRVLSLALVDITTKCFQYYDVFVLVETIEDEISIPNIFSPDDNGVNDEMIVHSTLDMDATLSIYDRWGNLVYQDSKLLSAGDLWKTWDGRLDGKHVNPGVFVYYFEGLISSDEKILQSGTVTVIR